MTNLLFSTSDQSGWIQTGVFVRESTQKQQHWDDFEVEIPSDWVLIGGGGMGADNPGAYLTASYPNENRTAWLVSTRDHRIACPHRVTGYAIGMKWTNRDPSWVRSLLRFESMDLANPWARPAVTTFQIRQEFHLIGGGFRVESGKANLMTASFPEFGDKWKARSKDHIDSSPARLKAWAIGIRKEPTIGVGSIQKAWGRIERYATTNDDFWHYAATQHPTASVVLNDTFDGVAYGHSRFALTGVGAEVYAPEPGLLLWKLRPQEFGTDPNGLVEVGVDAAAKDHEWPAAGYLRAWTIGILFTEYPNP